MKSWRRKFLKRLIDLSQNALYININYSWSNIINVIFTYVILRVYLPNSVIFLTKNDNTGEVNGFQKFINKVELSKFDILLYFHSKGVTKPHNQQIEDWVSLMSYFIFEKMDLMKEKFKEGYALYGVNLGTYNGNDRHGPFKFSDFHYSGNFVAVNLKLLRNKIKSTPVDLDYFGVEGYWGKLCNVSKAYNAHDSSKNIKNHYTEPYPEHLYKNT